ncbi:HP0495 family protein [Aidingimonas halophila]|uniref:UPF0250 protein SAMN05443545_10568 n=1 Tax=Aidingimonas halophila TaxID=574349 RepID=A0A1H3AYB2_9GAMM|nr:DUF493 domain-containing protein [Aidingimonas halophila]GHC25591.1 UPF0250 protein [Aidingimonas halophila]SDX34712.1 hypothetical protein SAMN05443545_10568 [Aidingimonas halophila]
MSDSSLRDLRKPSGDAGERPKIEFPCRYPLKIVGDADDGFHDEMIAIVEYHAPEFDRRQVQIVDSRNGRFQSLRVTITATGNEQLQALFADLKATGRVHMVL